MVMSELRTVVFVWVVNPGIMIVMGWGCGGGKGEGASGSG